MDLPFFLARESSAGLPLTKPPPYRAHRAYQAVDAAAPLPRAARPPVSLNTGYATDDLPRGNPGQ